MARGTPRRSKACTFDTIVVYKGEHSTSFSRHKALPVPVPTFVQYCSDSSYSLGSSKLSYRMDSVVRTRWVWRSQMRICTAWGQAGHAQHS